MTEEILDKKINDLVASRGRKNTDPREVLRKLEVLSKSARPLGECVCCLSMYHSSCRGPRALRASSVLSHFIADP